MFWKRKTGETPEAPSDTRAEPAGDPESTVEEFEIVSGAPRPATIIRLAAELERQGKEVVELFKEIESPKGRVLLPVHAREGEEDLFVELETAPWDQPAVERITKAAALLRSSEYRDARLELFSAHPAPEPVTFLLNRSPAALLQLCLIQPETSDPESLAESFREAAQRCWEVDLDYTIESLPLTEELLSDTFSNGKDQREKAPVLDALVRGLGCYLGEVIRRNASRWGRWREADDWGEGSVIEFQSFNLDPIGMSRAFLSEDQDDSLTYYARYALEEINAGSTETPEVGESRDQA